MSERKQFAKNHELEEEPAAEQQRNLEEEQVEQQDVEEEGAEEQNQRPTLRKKAGNPKQLSKRREQKLEKDEESKRIADLAKQKIPQWLEAKRIVPIPVRLTEETYLPKPAHEGFHYCIVCGEHRRFRLPQHMAQKHYDFTGDDLKVVEQVSRGITEKMKNAEIHVSKIPNPTTQREYRIYKAFVDELKNQGVPVLGEYSEPEEQTNVVIDKVDKTFTVVSQVSAQQGSVEVSHASEPGPSGRSQPSSHLPMAPTADAKYIPRSKLYMFPGDKDFTVREEVHEVFDEPPDLKLMFNHLWDDFGTSGADYFMQSYSVSDARKGQRAWMKKVDEKLKLWRKLRYEQHRLLERFKSDLEFILMMPDNEEEDPVYSMGRSIYVSYICRFMLAAMRTRKRIGEEVSMDDAIFSCEIVLPFFEVLQSHGVPVGTQRGFAKALTAFYKFLENHLSVASGDKRYRAVKMGIERVDGVMRKLGCMGSKIHTYKGVDAFPAKKEGELYCVARAVVTHQRVIEKLKEIYESFCAGTMCMREYNYFIGGSMSYIVQCNTARNECIYKMRYGSIFPTSRVESAEGSLDSFTGLRTITIASSQGPQKYWVGIYPEPKNVDRLRDKTTYRGNFFVLDSTSHQLMMWYAEMRVFVAQHIKATRETVERPKYRYFLKWDGKAVKKGTVSSLMERFLRNSGCGHLQISCNSSRHQSAKLQREEYVDKMYDEAVGGVDLRCALLAGHKGATQLRYYNDSYVSACAHGYRELERIANKEAKENPLLVNKVKREVRIVDLKTGLPEGEDVDVEPQEQQGDDSGENSSVSSSSEEDREYRPTGRVPRLDRQEEPRRSQRKKRKLDSGSEDPFEFVAEDAGMDEREEEYEEQRARSASPTLPHKQCSAGGKEQTVICAPVMSAEEELRVELESSGFEVVDEGEQGSDPVQAESAAVEAISERTRGRRRFASGEGSASLAPMTASVHALLEHVEPVVELDPVSELLQRFNESPYDGGLSKFRTFEEKQDFLRRRSETPVQQFTWLQVREIPCISGRGVFAKVRIPKNSIVCDYRGYALEKKVYDTALDKLPLEERRLIQQYAVEYVAGTGTASLHKVVVAYEPTYRGTVVLGRLINHSSLHANLRRCVYVSKEDSVTTMTYFLATKDIEQGQQLLWNYGTHYDKSTLRDVCLCEGCDPTIESTASLGPLQEQRKIPGPWNVDTS